MIRLCFAVSAAVLLAAASSAAAPRDILFAGVPKHADAKAFCRPLFETFTAEEGWGEVRAVTFDELTAADLASARLVIVYGGDTFALDGHERDILAALVGYAKAGGGLVIANDLGQMFAKLVFRNELMKALGGRILFEKVSFPASAHHRIGPFACDKWAYTDRVFPPFDDGVGRALVQSEYSFNVMHGVLPFLPTDEWKVALSAGRDVGSEPFGDCGVASFDSSRRARGFEGDTPLVGVREIGRGRAVWYGLQSILTRSANAAVMRETLERILFRGAEGGGPSGTGRFTKNLFTWASEHAAGLDVAAIPPLCSRAEYEKGLGRGRRFFRGVVGPRTVFSGGRSTAEEYIARAKALGLDFIAFLERLERISEPDYERLRAICERATDDRFTAWAGFTYENDAGGRGYAFSPDPMYPGPLYRRPDGKFASKRVRANADPSQGEAGQTELDFFYGMLSFNNNHGWYMFHDSPYRPTDNRTVQSMGVLTRVGGRTAESAFDAYRINNRNGQVLMPLALELVDSADELDEGSYLSVIEQDGVAAFRRFMMTHQGHSLYPGQGNYGCQQVSNGPLIEFRPVRGDYGSDSNLLYSVMYANWPYALRVSSDAGLDRVEIVDGDTPVRRWDAKGARTFERKGSFTIDRQRYLWVRVRDAKGRVAFTRTCNCETFLLRENQCGDRENQLLYSLQPRKEKGAPPYFSSFGADTCTPDKGPWNGRVRPVGFFVFDKRYGLGSNGGFDGSPEDHPQVNLTPSINYGGCEADPIGWVREFVAGREGGPHVRPERVVASSDALVGDRVLDGVFDLRQRPIIHVWHSLYPVFDSAYAGTRARCTLFLPKMDGVVPYQWEQTLVLKQPVPTEAGKPVVNFGRVSLSSRHGETAAMLSGTRMDGIVGKRFAMRPGDYLTVRNPQYGSLAVFPLDPIDYTAESLTLPGDGRTREAGTAFRCRLVAMGMNKFVSDPFAFAGAARAAYAIGGGTPAYRAAFTSGRGVPNGVCFDAVAEDGALVGRFDALAKLPGTLGLRLSGMDDGRSAVVLSKTGIRLVPVEKGVAYAALRDEESDCDLFIGHPFRSESRDLVLALSRPGKWRLEVHNPTDREIRAKVESDPRCTAFSFSKTLTVPAGTSEDFDL